VESFVYKWQTFLGGIASAGILTMGVAVPALAQAAPATDGSTSSTVAQTLGGAACQLTGLPMAGEVASASGALTMTGSCNSSSQAPDNTLMVNDSSSSTQTPSGANASGLNSLPGLNTVAGAIPGLESATSQVPEVSSLTGSSTGNSSNSSNAAFNPEGAPADAPASGTSNSSVVPGSLSGVTGALPIGSLTGTLPNVGGVTGALSGVTGSGH
jgi:hypothetical protein